MSNLSVEIMQNGCLRVKNAHITFRNFSGARTHYNPEGARNFVWVIPDEELAKALKAEQWRIVERESKYDDQEEKFRFLKVKVRFNEYGPKCYVESDGNKRLLNEDTVSILDDIRIASVNMEIRPYDWSSSFGSGRTAYLKSITVMQEDVKRLYGKYAEEEHPEE